MRSEIWIFVLSFVAFYCSRDGQAFDLGPEWNEERRQHECLRSGGMVSRKNGHCLCKAGFQPVNNAKCVLRDKITRSIPSDNEPGTASDVDSEIKRMKDEIRTIVRTAEDLQYYLNMLQKERKTEYDDLERERDGQSKDNNQEKKEKRQKTILIPLSIGAPPMPPPMSGVPGLMQPQRVMLPGMMSQQGGPMQQGMPPQPYSFFWMPRRHN